MRREDETHWQEVPSSRNADHPKADTVSTKSSSSALSWITVRFRSPIILLKTQSGPLPWDERTGCFAIRRKVPRQAPLYTPWWKARRQMGLSRSHISSMCWYSFHTLGSPHLMKNWKPSCLGHPISSKTTKFQIPMLTKNAISTSGRPQTRDLPFLLLLCDYNALTIILSLPQLLA